MAGNLRTTLWLASRSGDAPSPSAHNVSGYGGRGRSERLAKVGLPTVAVSAANVLGEVGAGIGIRTRDFDLGKVALYH